MKVIATISICSEGALYYTPLYQSEVDLMSLMGEEENLRLEIDEIHEKLIAETYCMDYHC